MKEKREKPPGNPSDKMCVGEQRSVRRRERLKKERTKGKSGSKAEL